MRCPFCNSDESRVVDSRDTDAGDAIRRRRECLRCERRFTTYERVDEMPLMVLKRDGSQEVWDRDKLLRGLMRACVKRDIPLLRLEQLVDEIENRLRQDRLRRRPGEPVPSAAIGEQALRLLRSLDKVAYVRFASVYRQFEEVEEFQEELSRLEGDVPEVEGQEPLAADPAAAFAWETAEVAAGGARTQRERDASRDLAVAGRRKGD